MYRMCLLINIKNKKMSKNNNNEKSPVISIIIVSVGILVFGYFLFKTSPQNPPQASTQNSNNANNMDSMHSQQNASVDNSQLNSLVGKLLPSIQLTDKDGKAYTAESFKGKNTVLFFNEGLMCYPACWNQIAQFGSDSRFNTEEIQAYSVLVDSSKDWQRAIDKMPELAKSQTLFDDKATVSRNLGLLTLPSSMHRGSLPGHTYIVLDKNAIVRYVFDDPNMAIANNMLFAKIGELN